jgi:hypothetical protein
MCYPNNSPPLSIFSATFCFEEKMPTTPNFNLKNLSSCNLIIFEYRGIFFSKLMILLLVLYLLELEIYSRYCHRSGNNRCVYLPCYY